MQNVQSQICSQKALSTDLKTIAKIKLFAFKNMNNTKISSVNLTLFNFFEMSH